MQDRPTRNHPVVNDHHLTSTEDPLQTISYHIEQFWCRPKTNSNGRAVSNKYDLKLLHFIPNNGRSSGWTGIILYALSKSSFARSDPRSAATINFTAQSTDVYDNEHKAGSMPSFYASPLWVYERSTISLHLPGWWLLGITPNLFT